MYNRKHSLFLPLRPPPGQCSPGSVRRVQRGFSLVELMVGLTIGLLVVLAAIGSLVFTQLSSSVLNDSSRLQQKADAALRNIGYHICQAGAFEIVAAPALASSAPELAKVVFSSAYTGFNATSFSVHGVEGASNAADTLRVSYEANASSHDCLGNTPSGPNVDNAFYVTGTDLVCKGATSSSAQSLADGVEDFQVVYGVQTGVTYRFYNASAVPTWASIQAVQICLQMVGDNKGNPQPGLVLKGCHDQTLTNDGLLRRVYKRTFSVRNALS